MSKYSKITRNNKRVDKNRESLSDTESQMKQFIIILVVLLVVVVGIYLLSKVVVNKREDTNNNETAKAGQIDYDVLGVGTILNRPYDEYYVLIYGSESKKAVYYASLITNYQKTDDALKIYYCDLDDALNKKYASGNETGNSSAKSVSEFSFGEVTLLKVKNGKVIQYIDSITNIEKELKK